MIQLPPFKNRITRAGNVAVSVFMILPSSRWVPNLPRNGQSLPDRGQTLAINTICAAAAATSVLLKRSAYYVHKTEREREAVKIERGWRRLASLSPSSSHTRICNNINVFCFFTFRIVNWQCLIDVLWFLFCRLFTLKANKCLFLKYDSSLSTVASLVCVSR